MLLVGTAGKLVEVGIAVPAQFLGQTFGRAVVGVDGEVFDQLEERRSLDGLEQRDLLGLGQFQEAFRRQIIESRL